MSETVIIGIAGGSGSGKTLFLKQLVESLPDEKVSILSLDNYYKSIDQQSKDDQGIENFDLPESLDLAKCANDIGLLKEGQDIQLKEYTFNNSDRKPEAIEVKARRVIVVEGIFTFYDPAIRQLLDLKLYVDAPDHLMVSRRIRRDAKERGYDLDDVLYRFENHVMPAFKQYIEPYKHEADLIIPNHKNFEKALTVVSKYIQSVIDQ